MITMPVTNNNEEKIMKEAMYEGENYEAMVMKRRAYEPTALALYYCKTMGTIYTLV